MNDRIVSDILGLLIPTLWIGFLWRRFRVREIPEHIKASEGRWRWILIGLLIPVYGIYVVTVEATPLLIRIGVASVELIAFSVGIYYCDQKLGSKAPHI